MEITPTYSEVAAQEVFGQATTIVDINHTQPLYDPSILGGAFQGLTLCLGLIYLICIAKYARFMLCFTLSAAGVKLTSRSTAHINPGEQTNIEIVMLFCSVLFLALAFIRGCTLWAPEVFNGMAGGSTIWLVGRWVVIALVALFLFEGVLIQIVGAVCEMGRFCHRLMHLKMMFTSVSMAAILPFGLIFLLSPDTISTVAFLIMAVECLILLIIFVKETFLFFVSEKISILHWILYLCALEIFPASLILAPLLRG